MTLNPTFEDLRQLATQPAIRICLTTGNQIAVASGRFYDHGSIRKRFSLRDTDDYIAFPLATQWVLRRANSCLVLQFPNIPHALRELLSDLNTIENATT